MSDDIVHHKLSFLEQKLEEYIRQNNTRLDQLLDLTRQIATVNERQSRNQSDIDDIRKRVAAEEVNSKDAFTRIHGRIDTTHHEVELVDKELHKWLNRGWGAWAVATLVFSVFQYVLSHGIDAAKGQATEVVTTVKKLETRVNELENMVAAVMSRK